MKKIISIFLVLLSFKASADLPDVVAFVNDKPITKYDFESRKEMIITLNGYDVSTPGADYKINSDILNMLIEEELLRQHDEKTGGSISENDIDDAIRTIEQRNNMPKNGMKAHIKEKGLDFNSFRTQIRNELIKQNIISSLSQSVTVSPNELDIALINSYQDFNIEAWIFTSKNSDAATKSKMQNLKNRLFNCDKVESKLFDDFADAEKFDRKLSLLPEKTQSIVMDNKVGTASNIYKQDDKYKMIFVCKKEAGVSDNDLKKVKSFLSNKKMSQKAAKFLKDMRVRSSIKTMIPG